MFLLRSKVGLLFQIACVSPVTVLRRKATSLGSVRVSFKVEDDAALRNEG